MANIVVEFNNKKYNAIYNKNTDEYEVELTAPERWEDAVYSYKKFSR